MFPPLLRSATSEIQQLVRNLKEDHQQMQLRWAHARATLCLVAEGEAGSWLPLSAEQSDTLQHFADLYANHIEVEEQLVYPQAKMHLTSSEIDAMQNDMMQRRGANKTIQINPQ